MKIIFLLQSFPCLSETFILNQITGLMDLGYDVKIVSFHQPNEEKQHLDIEKYRLFEKTTYIKVPRSKLAKRVKAVALTAITFMHRPVFVGRLCRELFARDPFVSYQKLFLGLTLIRKNCDVIHCHYGTIGNEAVVVKDIGLGAKISTVFHGYDLSFYLKEHGSDVYQALFKKGDIFLPVSNFWKEKLIALGCPAEKIIVNHMGVDIEKFRQRNQELSQDNIKVLTVGRLTEKKGYRFALQSIQQAIRDVPQLEYHIAGDGPLLIELQNMVKDLALENRVVFHGNVDSDEVLELYHRSHIFLLPSVTSSSGDMEGIPVSLMEAMACGLPVITSEHSGIPELVINGRTGYTVPEKDVESIADRLLRLAGDIELRNKMGCQAMEFIKDHFNERLLITQLVNIFTSLNYPRAKF